MGAVCRPVLKNQYVLSAAWRQVKSVKRKGALPGLRASQTRILPSPEASPERVY